MSYQEASHYKSLGSLVYFDKLAIPGARDITGFDTGGSTPETDITTLLSPRREFVPGLPDGGGVGMNVISSPHSEIYRKFAYSNHKQLTRKLDIFFGNVEPNDRRTAGNPIVVEEDIGIIVKLGSGNATGSDSVSEGDFVFGTSATAEVISTSVAPAAAPARGTADFQYGRNICKISCERDTAESFANGVVVGDFFERTDSAGNTHQHRIAAIDEVPATNTAAARVIFTLTKVGAFDVGTGADAGVSDDFFVAGEALAAGQRRLYFRIVRPGLRFSLPVYIANFSNSTGAGGLIEMQIGYRITGIGKLWVGDKEATAEQANGDPDLPTVPNIFKTGAGNRHSPPWFWKAIA